MTVNPSGWRPTAPANEPGESRRPSPATAR